MLQESPENVDFILKAPTSSYKSVLVAERKTRHKEQQSAIRTCAQIHGKIFPHWSLYKFQKIVFHEFSYFSSSYRPCDSPIVSICLELLIYSVNVAVNV